MIILACIVLIVMALLGAPLFVVFGLTALVLFVGANTGIIVLSEEHYKLATSPHLMTIPMFTFAGFLMAESNAARRLVRVSRALLGWMPGGLAIVVVAACAFFTTFTGASGVTIIALGGLLYPMLLEEKYPKNFSLGLITSSGSIGLLFPPSLPIILYGIVANTSIDDLFVAGVLPGALIIGMMGAFALVVGVRSKVNRTAFQLQEAVSAVWEAKWELAVPLVVVFGIYGLPDALAGALGVDGSGLVTIAEASVLCTLYLLVIETAVYKDLKLFSSDPNTPSVGRALRESMVMVGAIMCILGVSLGFTNYLIQEEVPTQILGFIQEYVQSRATFLILLTVFLLIVGCLMDIFSAIVVVVPLIAPIAAQYGVHPVHLGIIFLANLELGYLTPPVGLNLFISSLTFNRPVVELYRLVIPFLVLLLVALLIITYWPGLSLMMLPEAAP